MRSIHILSVLLALATLLPACGGDGSDAEPLSGGDVRLAVLSPALAIILTDLDLADRIVARHAFDHFSNQAIPVAGDQSGVDYELLARADPTHVLLEWGARDLPPRLQELASARGWIVVDYPMLTLDDIRHATTDLGARFDQDELAASLLKQMDGAWSPAPEIVERAGRTVALYWTNPIGVAGPGSFHYQLLDAFGVTPALEAGAAYIEVDPEDFRRLDPDTIVLFVPNADSAALEEMLSPLERLDLRAVDEQRIVLINHPWCQTPSTAMIEVAEQTRAALAALTPSPPAGAAAPR